MGFFGRGLGQCHQLQNLANIQKKYQLRIYFLIFILNTQSVHRIVYCVVEKSQRWYMSSIISEDIISKLMALGFRAPPMAAQAVSPCHLLVRLPRGFRTPPMAAQAVTYQSARRGGLGTAHGGAGCVCQSARRGGLGHRPWRRRLCPPTRVQTRFVLDHSHQLS